MSNNDYEYRGLVARSWDFLRGDTSVFPDRQMYRDIIENKSEPALIVGCGTGRLLLEYRADGFDVDGLDISPEMVDICRQKASKLALPITVYIQPMEALDLPRSYQKIIVPSCSFQLVTDIVAAENALAGFHKHLLPGGTLVSSIWHIKNAGTGEWGDWWQVYDRDGFEGNKRIRRWERSMFKAKTQLRHAENRYEIIEDGEVVYEELHRQSPELRNYSLDQLTNMLARAGYSDIHAVSGFSNEPASNEDGTFTIFARRKQID